MSARRWLARAALITAAAAVVVLLVAPGVRTVPFLLLVAGHYVAIVLGVWLFLAHRGLTRVFGGVLALGAAISVPVLEAVNGLLWVSIVCVALLAASYLLGRAAVGEVAPATLEERTAPTARQPFLIMNPRSGGGKVTKFALRERAEELGAEVALLEGPDQVDVENLARKAVANGADLLGVAGGDGTQALVAGVAAEHDVPLLVIPAGTRNHFALDLGLDRDDPSLALDALTDGVEVRVDLGDVSARPFVNNVSFGAYAAIVARPDYRNDKVRVTLDALPELLAHGNGPALTVRTGSLVVSDPSAALVSNNPYGTGDIAGLGRRSRVDRGVLGLVAVSVSSAREAVRLLRGRRSPGVVNVVTDSVVVEADAATIAAGVDGESVILPAPVRCLIRPAALRVRLPRSRPGVPAEHEPLTLSTLWHLAAPAHPRHA